MNFGELLLESKWNLSVGTELSNPRDTEMAVVKEIKNWDLSDEQSRQQFIDLVDKYKSISGGRRRSGFSSATILNQPGDHKFAHTVLIKILVSKSRKDKEYLYVSYDDSDKKVWSGYAGVSARRVDLNTQRGREKLKKILSVNLLPVEPTMNGDANFDSTFSAGSFWQVIDIGAVSARARDRLKPNTNSKLMAKEKSFWNKHPLIADELQKLVALNAEGKSLPQGSPERKKIESAAKEISDKLKSLYPQVMRDYPTADMLDNHAINPESIIDSVETNRARWSGRNRHRSFFPKRKKEYLGKLISKFTDNINNPSAIYPMTIIDNVDTRSTMTNIGISNSKSITTDFMEIVHPVSVVSGNFTGTAHNYIEEFLGADYATLVNTASILYGESNTQKLIDSFIYNKLKDGTVRKLQLSSKSGKGAAAAVKSIQVAIDEVERNPTSRQMWEEINENPDYDRATRILTIILENKDYSWQGALKVGVDLGIIEPRDSEIITELARLLGKNVRDKDDEELDEDLGTNESQEIQQLLSDLSDELKSNAEDFGNEDDELWSKLIGSIWQDAIAIANTDTAFSNLVVWLFNHSATLQVNTKSHVMKDNGVDKLVLTNITATWPTQLVDSAKLVLANSGSPDVIRFVLDVDGHAELLGLADIAPPLSNRTDVSTMSNDNPKRQDANAKRDRASDLTPQEKELRFQRKVGDGTDNIDLPPKQERERPEGEEAPERVRGRGRQVSQELASYRDDVRAIFDFIRSTNSEFGIGRGANSIDSVLQLARRIYTAELTPALDRQLRELYTHIQDLVSQPEEHLIDIIADLNIDTEQSLGESVADQLTSSDRRPEDVVVILHILYYAILARYTKDSNPQLHDDVINKIKQIENGTGGSGFSSVVDDQQAKQMAAKRTELMNQRLAELSTKASTLKKQIPNANQPKIKSKLELELKAIQAEWRLIGKLLEKYKLESQGSLAGKTDKLRSLNSEITREIATIKTVFPDYNQSTAYTPSQPQVDPHEQRIQRIIGMARQDGRAKDEQRARQEIANYGDEPDADIASVLSETRSNILRGITISESEKDELPTIKPRRATIDTIKSGDQPEQPEQPRSNIMKGVAEPKPVDTWVDTEKEFTKTAQQQSDDRRRYFKNQQLLTNFINSCIPSEFEAEEERVAREWLYKQLTEIGTQYQPPIIYYALRSFFMVRENRKRLDSQTIESLVSGAAESFQNIDVDDTTAIARIRSKSIELGDNVIATVMSDLNIPRLNLIDSYYHDLAGILGQKYSANKISSYVSSKYGIINGIFILFRNLKDPGVYSNVAIDVDKKVIWGGQSTTKFRRLTDQDSDEFNEVILKRLIWLNNNDRREQALYTREQQFLHYVQYLLNSDKTDELYRVLRTHDYGSNDEWTQYNRGTDGGSGGDTGARDTSTKQSTVREGRGDILRGILG